MKSWWRFIQERFEPFSHLLMISCFFLANATIGYYLAQHQPPFPLGLNLIGPWGIIVLLFFHLRLFDEIKDYQTDLLAHPERPLARGLIPLKHFKGVTIAVVVMELALSSLFLKGAGFAAAVLMISYSLLMFKEFFMGAWLRPKMELYALTHTIVAGIMGVFVALSVGQTPLLRLDGGYLALALLNWMIFNIFEFGRKTFARNEEEAKIESYSKRLRPAGAVLLLLANAILACVFFEMIARRINAAPMLVVINILLTVVLGGLAVMYIKSNARSWAKVYRTAVSLYMVLFNIVIIAGLWWQYGLKVGSVS